MGNRLTTICSGDQHCCRSKRKDAKGKKIVPPKHRFRPTLPATQPTPLPAVPSAVPSSEPFSRKTHLHPPCTPSSSFPQPLLPSTENQAFHSDFLHSPDASTLQGSHIASTLEISIAIHPPPSPNSLLVESSHSSHLPLSLALQRLAGPLSLIRTGEEAAPTALLSKSHRRHTPKFIQRLSSSLKKLSFKSARKHRSQSIAIAVKTTTRSDGGNNRNHNTSNTNTSSSSILAEDGQNTASDSSTSVSGVGTNKGRVPALLTLEQDLARFPRPFSEEECRMLTSNEIPAIEIEKLSIGVDAGGMGIIHVAEWRGVKVAIKEASAQVISKEVEIYNRMKGYEGVVQFYGVTYPPGLNKLCIVTKYAENGSLSWYLKAAFHKLTWAHKLQLASQIASGIARLHQEGIYHRDLHGGNILIDSQGNAMLTDFGTSTVMEERVARSMDEFMIKPVATEDGVQPKFISGRLSLDSDEQDQQQMGQGLSANKSLHHELSALTIRAATDVNMSSIRPDDVKSDDEKTYPLIGVMAYIAPERFRNPRFFDARCDIYSLGVLLWELTSGHSAFAKMAQDVQLAVAILNGKREQPIEGTPLTYQELYEQCWEPMPETRPSLDEILSTLEAVRTSMSEEQLATTRERSTAYDDTGAEFQESLSIPRPTSDYQKYLAFTQDRF